MSMSPEVRAQSHLFVRHAIEYGVLKPVDTWNDDEKRGDPAIVVACGDMHQVRDRLTHCWERTTELTQLIMANGGGLLLDGCSPANHPINFAPYIVAQINGAIKAKEEKTGKRIRRLILYFDFECGIACEHNLSAAQSCRSAVNAKQFLGELFPDREVALKFYLDRPADVLGVDHPLVREHCDAPALTFYFGSKAMEGFLEFWDKHHVRELATA